VLRLKTELRLLKLELRLGLLRENDGRDELGRETDWRDTLGRENDGRDELGRETD
jgi:hypothetical protein